MSKPNPSYQRAKVFYEQKRYAEAEKYFYEALSIEPRNTTILYELAFCQYMQKGREKTGLETVQSAIAIEPNESHFHALAALILSVLGQSKQALESAKRAVELEPDDRLSFVALSSAHLSAENWKEAEKAARQALALDPNSTSASSQLIHALRMQGKKEEAKSLIEESLAKNPERVPTRSNAGWAALQRGDTQEAKEHFLEVLRLDPSNQYGTTARQGLLQSLKAQSMLYRAYLKFSFFAEKLSQKQRAWFFIIIPILLIKLLPAFSVKPWAITLAGCAIAFYWLLFLWGHIAESVGNLILLKSGFARQVLSLREKQLAVFTGACLLFGPLLAGLGFWLERNSVMVAGIWLFALVIPSNSLSNSETKIEKILFSVVSLFYLSVIGALIVRTFQGPDFTRAQLIAFGIAAFILPAILSWVRVLLLRRAV